MQGFIINIKKKNHDYTERELQIFRSLIMTVLGNSNARTIKMAMSLNPVDMGEDHIFNNEVVLEKDLYEEIFSEFYNLVEKGIGSALRMAGVENYELDLSKIV